MSLHNFGVLSPGSEPRLGSVHSVYGAEPTYITEAYIGKAFLLAAKRAEFTARSLPLDPAETTALLTSSASERHVAREILRRPIARHALAVRETASLRAIVARTGSLDPAVVANPTKDFINQLALFTSIISSHNSAMLPYMKPFCTDKSGLI